MRRRHVLATVAGLAGAGCSGLGGSGAETVSLTPAPVQPSDGGPDHATPPAGPPCPALPSNAEVYVCAATADGDGLTLSTRRTDGSARVLELHNGTRLAFDTGADWWTLAARRATPTSGGSRTASPDRWRLLDQGEGTDDRRLDPGERFRWVLDGPPGMGPPDRGARLDLSLPRGRYAFSVVGYVPGGELTAVVRPFEAPGD